MVYRRVYCCYCASFGFDASILCALRSVPTMKTYGMVSLHSFTAWHIHSRHHKHLGKILHDHSFLTIEKSQHQLNGSCELGIIYIFQQPDDFFPPFYDVRMKFTQVVPCTWLPKGAKPGFKSSLLGSRDRAFYHSLLVLMKMMVMTMVIIVVVMVVVMLMVVVILSADGSSS